MSLHPITSNETAKLPKLEFAPTNILSCSPQPFIFYMHLATTNHSIIKQSPFVNDHNDGSRILRILIVDKYTLKIYFNKEENILKSCSFLQHLRMIKPETQQTDISMQVKESIKRNFTVISTSNCKTNHIFTHHPKILITFHF